MNYVFNYSLIKTTKQQIVSDYNFKNNTIYDKSSFYKKELNIPPEHNMLLGNVSI